MPIVAVPRLRVEQRKRIELLSGKHLVLDAKRVELPGRISGLESSLCDAELALSEVPTPSDSCREEGPPRRHQSRSLISGTLGRKMGLKVVSTKTEDGGMHLFPFLGAAVQSPDRFGTSISTVAFSERFRPRIAGGTS